MGLFGESLYSAKFSLFHHCHLVTRVQLTFCLLGTSFVRLFSSYYIVFTNSCFVRIHTVASLLKATKACSTAPIIR